MAAQVYYIKLTALTPVHVGVENEKHWKPGLDAVIQNGSLYVIDLEKVMQKAGGDAGWIDELSLSISQARIDDFLRRKNIRLPQVSSHVFPMPDSAGRQDVRPFIRTGGRPFVPGSSLKGAIRSAMIHHLNRLNNQQKTELDWFGQIGNNLMRFLQIGDGHFNNSKIILTKILSSQLSHNPDNNRTGWKHQRQGMISSLSPGSFSTCYETIAQNETAYLRISFQADALRIAQKVDQFNANYKNLFPAGAERQNFISMLNQYTRTHLEREIEFLKTFRPETHDDLERRFEEILHNVNQDIANNSATAYLRMGHGIGFHAITGDWQHPDHLRMVTHNNDTGNHRTARKTRKLVIEEKGPLPMGFIRLDFLDETSWKEGIAGKNEEWDQKKNSRAASVATSIASVQVKEEEVPAAPAEPVGPEYKEFEKVRQGDVVDAICIRAMPGNPKQKEFKLLLTHGGEQGKEPIIQLGYADQSIVGTLCRVRITQFNKQKLKINAIEFAGKK